MSFDFNRWTTFESSYRKGTKTGNWNEFANLIYDTHGILPTGSLSPQNMPRNVFTQLMKVAMVGIAKIPAFSAIHLVMPLALRVADRVASNWLNKNPEVKNNHKAVYKATQYGWGE